MQEVRCPEEKDLSKVLLSFSFSCFILREIHSLALSESNPVYGTAPEDGVHSVISAVSIGFNFYQV